MARSTWLFGAILLSAIAGCGGTPQAKDGPEETGGEAGDGGEAGTHNTSPNGRGGVSVNVGQGGGRAGGDDGGAAGNAGASSAVCGDGSLGEGERCDDANSKPGDGCDGLCRVEPGYICPEPGKPCELNLKCGDGKPGAGEACDDKNTESGDGCSKDCSTIEPGWICQVFGEPCTETGADPVCGNKLKESGEGCDDGNTANSDGCTSACQVMMGWECVTPGEPCTKVEYCGDGLLNGTEQCDDGNTRPGDCCDGKCQREANCVCTTPEPPLDPPHQICTSTMVCGDGAVTGSEACDDENADGDDGCSADCNIIEPGFTCPPTGGPCEPTTNPCGNAKLDSGEKCDDANTKSGDGCSADCKVEPLHTCPEVGAPCKLIEFCGDGTVNFPRGEQCDNDVLQGDATAPLGGDGCSANCRVESGWSCDTSSPSVCIYTVECGDKKIGGKEQCDDGVDPLTLLPVSSDGCSDTCELEEGYSCPAGGAACRPICGDTLVVGREECDDGVDPATAAPADGDGCSATCKLEEGWVCPEGESCRATVCGDGTREGSEQCDDNNVKPYDGCSPTCTKEPTCGSDTSAVGACVSQCGDGMLLNSSEACDDGNTMANDGCSPSCEREEGYDCSIEEAPSSVLLPIVIRDFRRRDRTDGHPDFQNTSWSGETPGTVMSLLDVDRKPVYAGTDTAPMPLSTGKTAFDQWYRDDAAINYRFDEVLDLARRANGSYAMDSATDAPWAALGGYFPIEGEGFGNQSLSHNYHFTSELRYWFEYKGGEILEFSGDDDVWVFINGRLAVDIGGIHERRLGRVELDSTGVGAVCDENDAVMLDNASTFADCPSPARTIDFGLTLGNLYEVVVFQAERKTSESNYWLTLTGFLAGKTECNPICGDGIVTRDEACDNGRDPETGESLNTGEYGGCTSTCTLAPACGDGEIDTEESEVCDDGINTTLYDDSGSGCGPGCVPAHYCGDSSVETDFGEECDDGEKNSASAYGVNACTDLCRPAPYCGDNLKNGSEVCDDGADNGTPDSVCDETCQLKCGNGTLEPGEECDEGAAENVGGYGGCRSDCTLAPYCGDGTRNGPEECDDGKNDGSYGTCKPDCTAAPFCGDHAVDAQGDEVCDQGDDNVSPLTAYNEDVCTTRCLPAPICGDEVVDSQFGEECDEGDKNSGADDAVCGTNCKFNPVNDLCGNGKIDDGEECDEGDDNGTASSGCDLRCQKKCGNGIKEDDEECDNGKNDGSYGTCMPNCRLADYCGDGEKNGKEECDKGKDNQVSPYGEGKCTTECKLAPYCGDDRVQAPEQCDGQAGCNALCTFDIPK